MDDMPYAMWDLVTGGEDEERQDFISPAERRERSAGSNDDEPSDHGDALMPQDYELPVETRTDLERSIGVRLDGLYAVASDLGDGHPIVQVSGEISSDAGRHLGTLAIVGAVYDSRGRMIGTLEHSYFDSAATWDAFSIIDSVVGAPAKVRVFVRSSS